MIDDNLSRSYKMSDGSFNRLDALFELLMSNCEMPIQNLCRTELHELKETTKNIESIIRAITENQDELARLMSEIDKREGL